MDSETFHLTRNRLRAQLRNRFAELGSAAAHPPSPWPLLLSMAAPIIVRRGAVALIAGVAQWALRRVFTRRRR